MSKLGLSFRLSLQKHDGLTVDWLSLIVDRLGLTIDGLGLTIDGLGLTIDGLGLTIDELGLTIDGLSVTVNRLNLNCDHISMMLEGRLGYDLVVMIVCTDCHIGFFCHNFDNQNVEQSLANCRHYFQSLESFKSIVPTKVLKEP